MRRMRGRGRGGMVPPLPLPVSPVVVPVPVPVPVVVVGGDGTVHGAVCLGRTHKVRRCDVACPRGLRGPEARCTSTGKVRSAGARKIGTRAASQCVETVCSRATGNV